MTDFNFANDEQVNAFARELGMVLRRIAGQGKAPQEKNLPKPTEVKSKNSLLSLANILQEHGDE